MLLLKSLIIFSLVAIMIIPFSSADAYKNKNNNNLPLMVGVHSNDPLDTYSKLDKNLNSKDTIVFNPSDYSLITGLNTDEQLATGGTSFFNLNGKICNLPSNVKIITYDYEPDFTPEYTNDQVQAIEYFQILKDEANSCGKKLAIVPVFIYTASWDWKEVSKHTDIIIMQVQNFQRGAEVPQQITPEALGVDLKQVTTYLVNQVDENTELYLQMGSSYGSNAREIYQDYKSVKDLGVDGVTLWFSPDNSNSINTIIQAVNLIR